MSTFEGPMMSIKTVNSLSHYTDWGIGARSFGLARLGRVHLDRQHVLPDSADVRPDRDVVACASSPRISGSPRSASCSTSQRCGSPGVMQGLMWRATNADGTLTYAFVGSGQGHVSVLRDTPCWAGRCSSPACCSWPGTCAHRRRRRAVEAPIPLCRGRSCLMTGLTQRRS